MTDSSDRPAWLAERLRYLTSSDCAAVLGESSYRDRGQVVAEKLGISEPWAGNEQTMLGRHLEDGIAAAAREKWGWPVRKLGQLVVDPWCPDHASTPDWICESPWGACLMEIKLTTCRPTRDCKPTKTGPSTARFAHGAPLDYQIQQQSQLACMELDWSVLLVLHAVAPSFTLEPYLLRRHEGTIARIREAARSLMRDVRRLRGEA